MTFIAKVAPVSPQVGNNVYLEERPMYGGKEICSANPIFIWESETQGGQGLRAHGVVLQVEHDHPKLRIEVRIDQVLPLNSHFSYADIKPFRDYTDDTPIAGLARKLCRHAHNKVAALTIAEGEFLSRYFQ